MELLRDLLDLTVGLVQESIIQGLLNLSTMHENLRRINRKNMGGGSVNFSIYII